MQEMNSKFLRSVKNRTILGFALYLPSDVLLQPQRPGPLAESLRDSAEFLEKLAGAGCNVSVVRRDGLVCARISTTDHELARKANFAIVSLGNQRGDEWVGEIRAPWTEHEEALTEEAFEEMLRLSWN
ncbi:MAG: hypothetical protein R3322_00125 [Kiloniellales bacterium]|nr:hypothetical protein [Kiloniellales bacterium]